MFIDNNFIDLFGTSETTDVPSPTGTASQAEVSQVAVAELYDVDTPAIAMTVPAKAPDIRPHFRDQITGRWVLLDSGATACIYPKSLVPAAAPDAAPALKAANGSPITT